MQVKIFTNNNILRLEESINIFLKNDLIKTYNITQSSNTDGWITISIFYK